MAMNKVYMAFTLVFLSSLLAVSMVESRTLTDILEEKKPNIAEASSRVEAHSIKGNNDKLNGALPINLEPNVLLSKDAKPTSSLRPIRTTDDATPIRMKVDRAKPIWLTEYKPTWLIDDPNPVMIGDENIDVRSTQVSTDQHVIDEILPNTNSESTKNVQSTQVIDQPEGTATAGTGQTPTSVRKSMMRNLPTELAKAYSTSSSGFEELSKTKTSSSIDADSYVVNGNTLRSALPRNLKADVELSDVKTLTTTSSSKPITTTDAAPVSVANPATRTSLEPVTNHSQSSVLEESSKTGEEESTEHVISTQVTNQSEGTATVETELTPASVSNSMISSIVTEEIPKTKPESADNVKAVPRAIGAHVFYGKMVSGSEMYNMTSDEYYNQIYPTHKCDVFLIGKLLRVADTPHNRMVFAKFAEEESDSTSDDSSEKDVATDH